ncbi:Splicing factor 3A subunit 1 [Amphibalanus amphitrite]|uniref:Splicing factor 3A subunit 1 n=1 Tax=Amphibalanus amphitrite TaxID=1232801 RepID=A0A6A4VN26_AMPAM|nr:Splicing factor 3A subunit 1 [Amphibalanus amphitrite]
MQLQWAPAHCGLADNERADALAKEAAGLSQQMTPVDVRTLTQPAMPPAVADPESGERVVKELPALMDGSAADTDAPDTSTQEVHKPKHVVGIILPPPEVRNIVDKTASFVARNGPEFESRIRQNELNNPKFNFLNGGDPYHAYYQHRVEEIREGKAEPVSGSLKPLVPLQLTPQTAPGGGAASSGPGAAGTQVRAGQEMFRPAAEKQLVVTEPPPAYEFTADPPSISSVDLDIVKLTAQFVARNGRQFLTNLMNREQRNYQFDFLRPQHSLFQYFTKLLEQYTKVGPALYPVLHQAAGTVHKGGYWVRRCNQYFTKLLEQYTKVGPARL